MQTLEHRRTWRAEVARRFVPRQGITDVWAERDAAFNMIATCLISALGRAVLRLPTVWIPPTACDGTIVTAIEVRPAPPSFGAAVRRTLRFRRRV